MKYLVTYIISITLIVAAGAQTREDLLKQKQKAIEEIELTRQLIEKTSREKKNSVNRVRVLDRGIKSREKLIRSIESEIYLINLETEDLQKRIKELSLREARYRKEYVSLIYFVYKNHAEYEKIMYILASNSISQAYQRYKYLKYITDYRKKVVHEIENLIIELKNQEKELNSLRHQKLLLLEARENENSRLSQERNRRSTMIRSLQREERRLRKEILNKERIKNKLEEEIRKIIEEEVRKMKSNNLYSALTPEQKLVSAQFAINKGLLPWPVERGVIIVPFGNADYPGLQGTKINSNGVDISSMPGTKARAVFDGEVTRVFAILGANYTVLIRHGDFLTAYQNLVNIRVKTGDQIKTKQVIGDVFTEQTKELATVHFEIWQEKKILNPEEWLSN